MNRFFYYLWFGQPTSQTYAKVIRDVSDSIGLASFNLKPKHAF
jgi:hypothetical protein